MDTQQLADQVVAAVRKRERRRWSLLATCAAVLALGLGVPIAITATGTDADSGTVYAKTTDNGAGQSVAPMPVVPTRSEEVYLTVLRYVTPSADDQPVWVMRHTCGRIVDAPGSCDPQQPLAEGVQTYLAQHVVRPVTWVDENPATIDNPEQGTLITLGPIDYQSDVVAHVAVETWCGGLCAEGRTLVVRRTVDTAWAVTGTTGGGWIS